MTEIRSENSLSHRDPNKDPNAHYHEFSYDPFWNDEEDEAVFKLNDNIDERIESSEEESSKGGDKSFTSTTTKSSTASSQLRDPYPEIVNKIPDDDEEIITITKVWVNKIMSDLGICPFTNGPDRAGLPMGLVHYAIDRSTTMEDVYARYWKEVVRIEQQPERDLATTLLIVPEFCIDNTDLFESFMNTLTQPLAALGVEELLQLVFFHPSYVFRDGAARSGKSAGAANYARRSPWPMINLLRTTQIRTAQRGIPTGLVYQQNEKTLTNIGTDALETMLRLCNWDDIRDVKVNRRDIEALRVAQDFQLTGQVQAKDRNVLDDVTPAVNKVAKEQVEQGNLVKVMLQALEKRLGLEYGSSDPTFTTTVIATTPFALTQLTGPETSATIMASDFVLNELDERIAVLASLLEANKNPSSAAAPAVLTTSETVETPLSPEEELCWVRKLREDEAHRLLLEDLYGVQDDSNGDSGDDGTRDRGGKSEYEVLMGRGGIGSKQIGRNDQDDDDDGFTYSVGMNPSNFY